MAVVVVAEEEEEEESSAVAVGEDDAPSLPTDEVHPFPAQAAPWTTWRT